MELIACYLDRVKRLNPVLNAYSTVMEDEALAAAREAEQEIGRGRYRGPLHGIPVSIKDNLAVKGYPTTAGSQILKDWKPDFDATVVARLREAGAIVLGKNNMHEWAGGGTTMNPYFGTTYNPWDTSRVPGGSSGGSAAAVAADLCLIFHWHRQRRLGEEPGGLVRHRGPQGHLRPGEPLRRRRRHRRLLVRPLRPLHQDRGGLRPGAGEPSPARTPTTP